MRIAFFTAGTTGAGHLVRGLAIERALQRDGSGATYALFGPRAAFRLDARERVREVVVDHEELLDAGRARESGLARALVDYAPDVLLVDLFWAPLRHVLPLLRGCEAWLLLRSAPPRWFVGPPGHPFERPPYARVIAIEPGAGQGHEDETIAPIVIANPEEARPRRALREALGVADGEILSVVQQAGKAGEWAQLASSLPGAHVFTFRQGDEPTPDPRARVHDGAAFFPLAEWLPGADAIASGAGYNAFWEARWLGYAERTRFVPFARPIDDQAWRARACADVAMRENGADVLARRLR